MPDSAAAGSVPARFVGRTVLVTGAGGGFGSAIARRAALEGADVVVHYRSARSGAEATAAGIRALGRRALLVQADLSTWDGVRSLVRAAYGESGRVDVLVNSAGDMANEQRSWHDLTQESLDRVIDLEVKGALLCTHEFGMRMLDQGGGAIVHIGSSVVVRGSARVPHYAAAKYAILGLTKSFAVAFAPAVRVNVFAPGFMETASTLGRADWAAGRRQQVLAATPMRTVPGPSELAGAALFLASGDAAHITGGLLLADGGMSMVGA